MEMRNEKLHLEAFCIVFKIFKQDEIPQFVNYGVNPTSPGLVYAAKGGECNKMIRETRECVTILPIVSVLGDAEICPVIFKDLGLTRY